MQKFAYHCKLLYTVYIKEGGAVMLIAERLEKIVEIIQEHNGATIKELADQLEVSKDTIRRDLMRLENEHRIERTFGGAIIHDVKAPAFQYKKRHRMNMEAKVLIGKAASKLIRNGDSIFFGSSSTVDASIPFLKNMKIDVLTNSLTVAQAFANQGNDDIYILPGNLKSKHMRIVGTDTTEKIKDFLTDYVFLGIIGCDAKGIYTSTIEEGNVNRAMIDHAQKVVVLADHSKFGLKGHYFICELDKIDILITDEKLDPKIETALHHANVEIIMSE